MIGLPPKPKFTKDEITNAALTVAREKGIGAVSAREVAVVLGTSTRPMASSALHCPSSGRVMYNS